MRHLLRSLRVRLVVTLVAVVGMISAVLGLGGVAFREWQLRDRFDHQLTQQAQRLALWISEQLRSGTAVGTLLDHHASPLHHDLYLQLAAGDAILARSRNLGSAELPADSAAVHTLAGDRLRNIPMRPGALRVATLQIHRADAQPLTLTVARSFDEVTEALAFLQGLFWVVIPSSLIVAALAGWIVTSRAMGRLDEVSQLARHVTPRHLDQRLDVSTSDDEISRLAGEVNHMLNRLESSFIAQERFITHASHELQTPIAVLLSEAQLLSAAGRAPTIDQYRAFVQSVEQEMRQLTRITASLLSLIRMESGELQRAETLVPLHDLLVKAVADCRSFADRQGVTIRLTLPDPGADPAEADDDSAMEHHEPTVVGDPSLLQIMVENLLRNAIRNSPANEHVALVLDLDLDQAIITVTDHGASLSDRGIQSAFDRSRIARRDGDGRQGSGLELAIAKTIAELHTASIGVRNRPPTGATFFVWLPLHAV